MRWIERIAGIVAVFVTANLYAFCRQGHLKAIVLVLLVILAVVTQFVPSVICRRYKTKKLRQTGIGAELLMIFLGSTALSVVFGVAGMLGRLKGLPGIESDWKLWVFNTAIVVLAEAVTFWNGMLRVYLCSGQLGIKWRGIGLACGFIPIVHLYVLGIIIRITSREAAFENEKLLLNEARAQEKVCATKYPILMVHGVFFRDFRYLNYWGRIPEELEKNGATIYYGRHQSALSVADSAAELTERMREIVEETGCGKLNVIAHSKGGLDCRYALSELGADKYVASLTTINTPHRGCEFADYLLSKVPEKQKMLIADTYNGAMRHLGDENPDFLAAVEDLTAQACQTLNERVPDVPGVYYQSVGSKLTKATGGRFPLNLTHSFVALFDGANDGLVGEKSFRWGEDYRFLTAKGKRGISHGDMIDLNRENMKGFDVREFYVGLVQELKKKGL